jgi:hypothetical protein
VSVDDKGLTGDWTDRVLDEVGERATRERRAPPPAGPSVRCAAEIAVERVTWLWKGRIPAGMLAVLDGDPGLGKSTITYDLGARVTIGEPLPGDACGNPPAGVVFVSFEEHPAAVMVPRLMAARADLSRVFIWDPSARPFSLPESLPELADVIRANGVRLVVIDPLVAAIPPEINMHRDQDARGVLAPVAALAEATACAFLFVRHLNKNTGGSALYRGGGSIGIVGAARCGMLLARDPDAQDDDAARVLAVTKCNVARMAPTLRLRLVAAPSPAPGIEVARAAWGDPSADSADELVQPAEERGELAKAIDLLRKLLAGGSVLAKDAQAALRANGITERTERRARQKLGIEAERDGIKGPWILTLPGGQR